MKQKKKGLSLTRRSSLSGFLFSLPAILGMIAFFLIPFGVSVAYSFSSGVGKISFVGLRNYIDILNNSSFQLAAGNTFKFMGISVPLIMALSLLLAVLLHRKLRGFEVYRAVFLFPMVLPVASVVLFFQILFSETGAFNDLLQAMNLPVVDWLSSPWAFPILVLLYLWKNCGYNIVLFMAALNSIPKTYYEAAEIDGAGMRTKFFRITLPLINPYLFFILVLSILNTFKSFREAFILCGSYPHESIYMVQHFMNNNFQNLNYVRLSTAAILIFLVVFALVFLAFWLRRKAGDVEI